MTPSGANLPPDAGDEATANLRMTVGGLVLQARITVPTRPVKPQAVLPALQGLVNAVVTASEQELADTGKTVSCKAGCGACCRQAVPISVPEAYFIRDLVEEMPEPRRAAVKARFADAGRRLKAAGLYDPMMQLGQIADEPRRAFGLDYFDLGIACPFLEEESCSIHPDRPLACREYLVTSPAERCARPREGGVEGVRVPKLSMLLRPPADKDGTPYPSVVGLSVALDWVEAHPDKLPLRPGTDWVQEFLSRLARQPAADHAPASTPAPAAAPSPAAGSDGAVVAGVRLPEGAVSAEAVLPALRALADAATRAVTAQVESVGDSISCKAGCGACCRQVVPVSAVEARRLAALVEAMPEPRRGEIRRRFAEGERRLSGWEHLPALDTVMTGSRGDRDVLAKYLSLGLACPFLEDESCSIYEDRPLVCREYLVTSDAKFCGLPDTLFTHVERVPLTMVATAIEHLSGNDGPPRRERTDMVRALSWAASHPDTSPKVPARRWLERFAVRLKESQAAAEARGWNVPEIAALVPFGGRGPRPAAAGARPAAPADTLEVPMPPGMVSAIDMLPTFRAYTNAMVGDVVAATAAKGKPISCRAGCGACCSQLVIVSTVEARRIAAVVDAMPEPRRSDIRGRFAEIERRVAAWDRAADYQRCVQHATWEDRDVPEAYFKLNMPCPFLEEGSCSIYEERPLICREYLVTSPAENCARFGDTAVQIEVLPSALAHLAIKHLVSPSGGSEAEGVPLTHALSWTAAHPVDSEPTRPAEVWLNRFFDRMKNVQRYGYAVEELADGDAPAARGKG